MGGKKWIGDMITSLVSSFSCLAQKRRLDQERSRVQREEEARKKVAAAELARNLMGKLKTQVFAELAEEGVFYDPLTREVRS